MKITETTRSIQEVYDKGDYYNALSLASEALDNTNDVQEQVTLGCLVANAHLALQEPPKEEVMDKIYRGLFENLLNAAGCIEDYWEISDNLYTGFNVWEANGHKKTLDFIYDNPEVKNYQQYIPLPVNYGYMRLVMSMIASGNPVRKSFMEVNNLSPEEYEQKYSHEGTQRIDDEMRMLMNIETAEKIFIKAKERISAGFDGNEKQVLNAARDEHEALITAELLCTYYGDECSETILCKGHKLQVEIKCYLLRAVIHYGANQWSLRQKGREKLYDEIDESIAFIANVEPEYVAPELPSREAIIYNPSETDSSTVVNDDNNDSKYNDSENTTTSSGGCYVATAVYGSYDCPQVWTLRRFRDNTLAETWYGRAFIHTYYAVSPTLVKWFGESMWFKNMWKPALDRLVKKLNCNGVANTAYCDKKW